MKMKTSRWQKILDKLVLGYQWFCLADSKAQPAGCDLKFSSRHRRRLSFSCRKFRI